MAMLNPIAGFQDCEKKSAFSGDKAETVGSAKRASQNFVRDRSIVPKKRAQGVIGWGGPNVLKNKVRRLDKFRRREPKKGRWLAAHNGIPGGLTQLSSPGAVQSVNQHSANSLHAVFLAVPFLDNDRMEMDT